jgi:hypothetical protein
VSFRPLELAAETLVSRFEEGIRRPPKALPPGMSQTQYDATLRDAFVAAREYFDTFGWIAEITIDNHDPKSSDQKARRIALRAVECIQLMLGARNARHFQLGGRKIQQDRRGTIAFGSDGHPYPSWSVDWGPDRLPDDWWPRLQEHVGPYVLDLLGIALRTGHETPKAAPMAQRLMDALSWFGEAAHDEFRASSLIKHVTAIERIVTTRKQQGVTKNVVERASALIAEAQFQLPNAGARLKALYSMRSKLVHGSRSPNDPGLFASLEEAETLARCVIYSFALFCGKKGLEDKSISNAALERAYHRLVERNPSAVAITASEQKAAL